MNMRNDFQLVFQDRQFNDEMQLYYKRKEPLAKPSRYKDTAIKTDQKIKFTLELYNSGIIYHSHILEHEESEMKR